MKRLLLLLFTLAIIAAPLCSCHEIHFPPSTSNTTTIEQVVPDATTPEMTVHEGTTPDITIPEDTTPEDTTPEGTTPENTTPEDTTPEDTTPEDTTPEATTPEDTTPENTTPEATTPEEVTPPTPPVDNTDYETLYKNMSKQEFYANYTPAKSFKDAYWRSKYGFMSGSLTTPDQAPTVAQNRPMQDGMYIRNSVTTFIDNNVYVLVDVNGDVVMEIYRGGAYITLEEVAAYVYAFGDIPANYTSKKSGSPADSIWGEYLRLNNSKFTGDTYRYPYEPELPNISGCGGDLTYYEIDIGTTGTDCDPKYTARIYNNGYSITRGAARIVYARYDANNNKIIDPNERYLFYTYNHYNDFQEYLNYYGGWGEMFGNITGGGSISSKYNYNPTPYVEVVLAPLPSLVEATAENNILEVVYFFCPIIDTKLRAA